MVFFRRYLFFYFFLFYSYVFCGDKKGASKKIKQYLNSFGVRIIINIEAAVNAFLDTFFFVFHTAFIVFILCGYVWKKTRKAHLLMVTLTAFSWFILGIWYGFGYCFLTHWHYRVRFNLGHFDMPNSYIKFIIDALTGLDANAQLVDTCTLIFFLAALIVSIIVNVRKNSSQ